MERVPSFKHWLACMGVMGLATASAGCGQLREIIIAEPKEVRIGVPQKCIDAKDVPAIPIFPLDAVDLSDSKTELARLVNAATLEVGVRKEYVGKINEVISKCTK